MTTTKSSSTNVNIGGGSLSLLTIAFVMLKLTHVIDWSWWWVLAPLWLPVAAVFVLAVLVVSIKIILKAINDQDL